MKKIVLVLFCLLLPLPAGAADQSSDRPHWSLEFKGGTFYPKIPDWKTYYGMDRTTQFAGSLAYRLLRQVEAGIEAGYTRDTGRGYAPGHGLVTGAVKYDAAPVNLFVLLRGEFKDGQWVVPYVGGGFTRMYYRERIKDQQPVRGSVSGYHGRAGIQFLMDNVDPSSTHSLFIDYNIRHVYFFIEAESVRAMADTVATTAVPAQKINLGGTSYFAGFLFEF